eukprot:TRINITY_DN5034_c0_g2_i2.p1 TRINITY_DN5034_c0_g2~~TRINITY_DN5034_c0_g2_i2.p1  ORF type:complete len:441 (+),score=137.26 TRINITY_DN5034_c0_g2_i2:161-1483(+)
MQATTGRPGMQRKAVGAAHAAAHGAGSVADENFVGKPAAAKKYAACKPAIGAAPVQKRHALGEVPANMAHPPPTKQQKQVVVTGHVPARVSSRAQPVHSSSAVFGQVSGVVSAVLPAHSHVVAPVTEPLAPIVAEPKLSVRGSIEPMAVDDMAEERSESTFEELYADLPHEDIDEGDEEDPIFCSEYVKEIFSYLREKEMTERIDCTYMTRQRDINAKMRGILVDWMAEVHLKFKLLNETLFLSVLIVDKYLAHHEVPRQQLQLLGVTAMLIASKVEEIYAVAVNDLVFICDKACSAKEIRTFERKVLRDIGWQLNTPSPLYFLRRFSKAGRADSTMHTMSKYLIELSLLDYQLLEHLPSQVAAAAVYLTRRMYDVRPYWNETLQYYTKCTEEDVCPCARHLQSMFVSQNASNLKCIFKKYSSPRFYEVAIKNCPTLAPF